MYTFSAVSMLYQAFSLLLGSDHSASSHTHSVWEEYGITMGRAKELRESRFISSRMNDGSLVLVDKEIIGNLNFTRNEKE